MKKSWLLLSCALCLFVVSIIGFFHASRLFMRLPLQAHELTRPVELPDLPFTLGGAHPTSGSLKDFSGKWIVLFFGFTHCSEICPTTLGYLKQEYEKLSETQKKQTKIVFASIDSDRDTPEACAKYAQSFNVDFSCVVFSPDATTELNRLIGMHFQKSDTEELVHSGEIYLISPDRVWTAYYRPVLQTGAMSADMGKLLRKNLLEIF